MQKLQNKRCIPCEQKKGTAPLSKEAIDQLFVELTGWEIAKNYKSIVKDLVFTNFDKAMDFVNVVADLAEFEGHHPDIDIRYNKVKLVLSTHSIGGLSENDFILAAKIDRIFL